MRNYLQTIGTEDIILSKAFEGYGVDQCGERKSDTELSLTLKGEMKTENGTTGSLFRRRSCDKT